MSRGGIVHNDFHVGPFIEEDGILGLDTKETLGLRDGGAILPGGCDQLLVRHRFPTESCKI